MNSEGVGTTFGAQRGAAVGLLADTKDTHRSSRRREDGQHVGRGECSTTFAGRRGADKSHTRSPGREDGQRGDHGKWSMTSSVQRDAVLQIRTRVIQVQEEVMAKALERVDPVVR